MFLSPGVGGAQRMSLRLATLLDTNIFEVVFVVVGKKNYQICDFIPTTANVKILKIRNVYDFLTIRIVRLLRKEKPYAVFCSQMYLNIRVILAAKMLAGIRIVIRHNSVVKNLKKMPLTLLFAKKICKYADRVISQTEEMTEELVLEFKVPKEKIVTLHNPIDEQQIHNKIGIQSPYPPISGPKYIMVGRVDPVKGYEFAIYAFAKVVKRIPAAQLYIVGDNSSDTNYYNKLIANIQELKITGNVHFEGYTDNPYIWIKNADVFMLTSKVEGLPNTLIEATYLQVPSISTRCANIVNEIVIDGDNGYLVNYGDNDALVNKMIKALDLPRVKSPYQGATSQEINKVFEFEQ